MKSESATYRAVLDSFWSDMDVLEWEPDEKLFYLWCITNKHLDICGCFEVSVRVMAHETGISVDRINGLIDFFAAKSKVKYDFYTRELLLLNWKKHNEGFFKEQNRNSRKAIKEGAERIKSSELKEIIFTWLGGKVAPSEAPTLPPTSQPKPKPKPEPEEELLAAASSQASTTPTPPAPAEQQQTAVKSVFADSENRIRTAFRERHDFLLFHFPHLQLSVEEEQCVAKYRNRAIATDAAVLVLEWCKRVSAVKPDVRSRDRPDEVAEVLAENDRVCAVFCGADDAKRLFCEVLSRLARRLKSRGGLPQALSDDLLLDWFESLHPLGLERIAWGARHVIENQVFFPSLSEFRIAVRKAPRSVVPVVRSEAVDLQRAENGAQALADILASLDAADGPLVAEVAA